MIKCIICDDVHKGYTHCKWLAVANCAAYFGTNGECDIEDKNCIANLMDVLKQVEVVTQNKYGSIVYIKPQDWFHLQMMINSLKGLAKQYKTMFALQSIADGYRIAPNGTVLKVA